ncbi:MAG: hypothetical protein HFJ45_02400 [Clostridia bacterium]|nr:hypothetical protein [Clostridia bacterium]
MFVGDRVRNAIEDDIGKGTITMIKLYDDGQVGYGVIWDNPNETKIKWYSEEELKVEED